MSKARPKLYLVPQLRAANDPKKRTSVIDKIFYAVFIFAVPTAYFFIYLPLRVAATDQPFYAWLMCVGVLLSFMFFGIREDVRAYFDKQNSKEDEHVD